MPCTVEGNVSEKAQIKYSWASGASKVCWKHILDMPQSIQPFFITFCSFELTIFLKVGGLVCQRIRVGS
jgi:hypothetical protein